MDQNKNSRRGVCGCLNQLVMCCRSGKKVNEEALTPQKTIDNDKPEQVPLLLEHCADIHLQNSAALSMQDSSKVTEVKLTPLQHETDNNLSEKDGAPTISDSSSKGYVQKEDLSMVQQDGQIQPEENEFLNSWFPEIDKKSYIIPVRHFDHIIAKSNIIAGERIAIVNKNNCMKSVLEIKERDETHNTVHALLTKVKDKTATGEVMVMITQARFSMYNNLVTAASASVSEHASLEQITFQKQNHSDLVIVNMQRGVLLGLTQSVHFSNVRLAMEKVEESVKSLTVAVSLIGKLLKTVPGADNVIIRSTLVLSQLTREQFETLQLQKAVQDVSCLCKDEMDTEKGLENWWQACWSSRCQDLMNIDVYRRLAAKFAIPATRVEIYLTTQPRLQLKHEHDAVKAVGDVHGAEVFQAGLHQLSLFPNQADLLDFDQLEETEDDVKFLWGPPGTGKTILLVLRALQWVKHFNARQIVILQTREDGTAASCMVEHQLQQTLKEQQERARNSGTDTGSAQCTFIHVDMSVLWWWNMNLGTGKGDKSSSNKKLEKLYRALGLQQPGQSDTAIHIVADEADGDVLAAVYEGLKELKKKGVLTIRMWAAGVEAFRDKENIPASLKLALTKVTEPLRCPWPVAQEVMGARQIKSGDVPKYSEGWQLMDGCSVQELQHFDKGLNGHTKFFYPWRCDQCVKEIASKLQLLHVGETNKGLSANDVFVLSSNIDCSVPNDQDKSPSPLIKGLEDNKYQVFTLSSKSKREEVMAVVKRDFQPPKITVAHEKFVWGLERKIVVYCETDSGSKNADISGRLRAFSRTTSLLIYIKNDRFENSAARVEIYMTSQPRLWQNFVAGLHEVSLSPTQATLLDSDYLEKRKDDVKFLCGPPGTGKTILLVLRALQWAKHFNAQKIIILQTKQDGTTASCLVEYQIQQTLKTQQQRARLSGIDTQTAQCTFTHVNVSGMWREELNMETGMNEIVLEEGLKTKLHEALDLQSGITSHILADEADGDGVAAVYQWLKEEEVPTVRLWAAGVTLFRDEKRVPAFLKHDAICRLTELFSGLPSRRFIIHLDKEDEFLNRWFADLDSKSYVIPITHLDFLHTLVVHFGDVPIGIIKANSRLTSVEQEIRFLDETHKRVHSLLMRIKNQVVSEEMVMMTQVSLRMYRSLVPDASATVRVDSTGDVSLQHIMKHKEKHSDFVIINKRRGVLVGVVQSAHCVDRSLGKQKVKESVTYLTKAASKIKNSLRTVPGAANITVHSMLVLTNITRRDLVQDLNPLINKGLTYLCKDQMDSDEALKHLWQACWSSEHLGSRDGLDSEIYRQLVAMFAIPATNVEIYLTTQPRLQLKHEHDLVNAVGDVHGAEVFQAGLRQLLLFPTQAELLDFNYLEDSQDDLKFLWGPPGTGKTILLVLRAMQWIKHFSARNIYILQTSKHGTAASYLLVYQLQQTFNAQQQRAQQSSTDTQSVNCTFTHLDTSEWWKEERNEAIDRCRVVPKEGWKEKMSTALGLQQHGQSDTAIHIVANEANGDVIAAVYQMLKEEGVTIVRLWAAGVEAFFDRKNIPASIQHAICHVTEPIRCPAPVVQEVMRADRIKEGKVPQYDVGWWLTGGPEVVQLYHNRKGRDGHNEVRFPWRCGQCAKSIANKLKSLYVDEADGGGQGLSANDVFILGSYMFCDRPDDDHLSPTPLINVLRDNGYNVRTLSSNSTRDEIMTVVKRDVKPPAITVANEDCVRGLERKIVVYCESGNGSSAASKSGRLYALSRSTSLLIYIESDRS